MKKIKGHTWDIPITSKDALSNITQVTKHRTPLIKFFTEEFATAAEAKKRELYWKSGAGRRKLKQYFKDFLKQY